MNGRPVRLAPAGRGPGRRSAGGRRPDRRSHRRVEPIRLAPRHCRRKRPAADKADNRASVRAVAIVAVSDAVVAAWSSRSSSARQHVAGSRPAQGLFVWVRREVIARAAPGLVRAAPAGARTDRGRSSTASVNDIDEEVGLPAQARRQSSAAGSTSSRPR